MLSQGILNGGQSNSLTKQLQQIAKLIAAGKNSGAIENLNSFVVTTSDLADSGVLNQAQTSALIMGAKSLIAALG